jgi:quinol monooxygenase YgiN
MSKAKNQIVCIARFTAKKGKQSQPIRSLRKLVKLTHQETGCIRYEVNQQIDNARIITLVEKWSDRKTFDLHCSMVLHKGIPCALWFPNWSPQSR